MRAQPQMEKLEHVAGKGVRKVSSGVDGLGGLSSRSHLIMSRKPVGAYPTDISFLHINSCRGAHIPQGVWATPHGVWIMPRAT